MTRKHGLTIDEDDMCLLIPSPSVRKVGDDSLDVLGRRGDEVDGRQRRVRATRRLQRVHDWMAQEARA